LTMLPVGRAVVPVAPLHERHHHRPQLAGEAILEARRAVLRHKREQVPNRSRGGRKFATRRSR
jgi:hypothetical protein